MATIATKTPARPVYAIAADIRKEWSQMGKGINYAAKPYLDAMASLNGPGDNYGAEDGKSVVLYFLSNAASFRGDRAKELKNELKKVYGIK